MNKGPNDCRQTAAPNRLVGAKPINLNTADSEDLAKLPGIGPDKAWDLIEHRPYVSWEDVKRVPGITPQTVEVMQLSGAIIEP